jgi:peroxiredoxin
MNPIALTVGDPAPIFNLPNQHGEEISLGSLKGKKVLLSWHPLAFTPVCELQMRALEIKAATFEELNTVALGMSVDTVPSKAAWARQMGVEKTHLLADFWPHGGVTKAYDLFIEEKGVSGRANILVDEQGAIEWLKVYEMRELPDIEAVIRHLKTG